MDEDLAAVGLGAKDPISIAHSESRDARGPLGAEGGIIAHHRADGDMAKGDDFGAQPHGEAKAGQRLSTIHLFAIHLFAFRSCLLVAGVAKETYPGAHPIVARSGIAKPSGAVGRVAPTRAVSGALDGSHPLVECIELLRGELFIGVGGG